MDKLKINVKPKARLDIKAKRKVKAQVQEIGPSEWKNRVWTDMLDFEQIYHISDIHIRPLQRHDEFRQVFDALDSYLQKGANGRSIAVITGDIFDNKTVFRPETFKLCRDMLKMITAHMPLLVIAGNHDMMENNTNRLDAITPVVDDIPNLYYMKYTGLCFCPSNKVCFVVSSLYDKGFIKYEDIVDSEHYRSDYQYIALYHGTLNGAKTDSGYVAVDSESESDPAHGSDVAEPESASASTRFRSLSDFDGYNAVLLGDIHKHQVMRQTPPVAYAGSLIQQNHGENLDGHGVLLWQHDPSQRGIWSCELQDINNQFGFVDIHCQDGQWINTDVELPPNCYARLVIKNCTETQIDMILVTLKTKVNTLNITKRQCISDNLDDFEIPPDIKRKEDELDLIREQAVLHHYDADNLISLHQEYQQELDIDAKTMSTAVWRPVSLEFKNLFGYGKSIVNKMNFKRGTISISANNACGKTSIVNIILFAIFGRTPLNPSNTSYTYDIINNCEHSGYVKILLNHGGQYYLIERKTIRKNTKAVTSTVLQKLNRYDFSCEIWDSNIKGEKLKSCTETRRNNNDTFIQDLFGDISDFSLSNLLNKESSLDLLSMTPVEQIKVLKKLFKLEIYDQYKELNKAKLQAVEKEIIELGVERKTLQPLIDDNISQELLDSKQQVTVMESAKLGESRKHLYELRQEQTEFRQAIQGYTEEIQRVQTNDLPLTDCARAIHQTELEQFTENPPLDTGLPTKALQYKLEDLGRQIDNTEGTIAELSVVPDRDALLDELTQLQGQLMEAQAQEIQSLDLDLDLDEKRLNRRLGDYNSKKELIQIQIKELEKHVQLVPEGLDVESEDVEQLRSQSKSLSSNLEAIIDRIKVIINELGGEEYIRDRDTDVDQLRIRANGMVSEISRLESDNRRLEIKRSYEFGLDLSDRDATIKQLTEDLHPDLPSVKYAVTQSDLDELVNNKNSLQTKIEQICSGRSFDDLLCSLNHEGHTHNGEYCQLTHDVVDDVVAYLHDGDHIRQLDAQLHRINSQMDRVTDQLQINIKIDHNKSLEAKIAQLTYLSNLDEIQRLRDEVKAFHTQIREDELLAEYMKLCAEEELHYDNLDIDIKVKYLDAVANLETLRGSYQTLNGQCIAIENHIYMLELQHNIELVQADLESHHRISGLRADLEKMQNSIDATQNQLHNQQQYDNYRLLLERDERLRIHIYNTELQGLINDVQRDLDAINRDIADAETQITKLDNYVKTLDEQLSVLNYRFREQESIKTRLCAAEDRLVQLELELIPYKEYNSIIGNKGITSKLLYNKIKSIEDYINTITQKFTKYMIHIVYDDKKQTINMITENKEDGHYLSTARLCGFEKLMLQIAFKRALNKFSYNSKSSLIIVDEAFDCIDQENFLTKLPEAINLITQDYSNCLAISQRDISHISDSILTIKQQGGCSQLFQ